MKSGLAGDPSRVVRGEVTRVKMVKDCRCVVSALGERHRATEAWHKPGNLLDTEVISKSSMHGRVIHQARRWSGKTLYL